LISAWLFVTFKSLQRGCLVFFFSIFLGIEAQLSGSTILWFPLPMLSKEKRHVSALVVIQNLPFLS